MKDLFPEIYGEPTGRALISLWMHFPNVDLYPEALIDRILRFQKKFPNDILKIPIHGRYCVVDFGCKISRGTSDHGGTGSSSCKQCVVQKVEDWEKIEYTDPLEGHYGEQLSVVKELKEMLPGVPMMLTVFSPTMVMRKLSNNQFANHYFKNQQKVEEAFKVVERVTIEYMNAALDLGIEGIFIATQEADLSYGLEREKLVEILNLNKNFAKSCKADFTVLHIHGEDVIFKEPIDIFEPTAVNWHDNRWPSILEAGELFKGGLLAGLDPLEILNGNINGAVAAKSLVKDIPLILAPNCVLLQGTEDETLSKIFKIYKE